MRPLMSGYTNDMRNTDRRTVGYTGDMQAFTNPDLVQGRAYAARNLMDDQRYRSGAMSPMERKNWANPTQREIMAQEGALKQDQMETDKENTVTQYLKPSENVLEGVRISSQNQLTGDLAKSGTDFLKSQNELRQKEAESRAQANRWQSTNDGRTIFQPGSGEQRPAAGAPAGNIQPATLPDGTPVPHMIMVDGKPVEVPQDRPKGIYDSIIPESGQSQNGSAQPQSQQAAPQNPSASTRNPLEPTPNPNGKYKAMVPVDWNNPEHIKPIAILRKRAAEMESARSGKPIPMKTIYGPDGKSSQIPQWQWDLEQQRRQAIARGW